MGGGGLETKVSFAYQSSAFVERLRLLQPNSSAPACSGCPRRFISTDVGVVG